VMAFLLVYSNIEPSQYCGSAALKQYIIQCIILTSPWFTWIFLKKNPISVRDLENSFHNADPGNPAFNLLCPFLSN
jgi:hypothetical protein